MCVYIYVCARARVCHSACVYVWYIPCVCSCVFMCVCMCVCVHVHVCGRERKLVYAHAQACAKSIGVSDSRIDHKLKTWHIKPQIPEQMMMEIKTLLQTSQITTSPPKVVPTNTAPMPLAHQHMSHGAPQLSQILLSRTEPPCTGPMTFTLNQNGGHGAPLPPRSLSPVSVGLRSQFSRRSPGAGSFFAWFGGRPIHEHSIVFYVCVYSLYLSVNVYIKYIINISGEKGLEFEKMWAEYIILIELWFLSVFVGLRKWQQRRAGANATFQLSCASSGATKPTTDTKHTILDKVDCCQLCSGGYATGK